MLGGSDQDQAHVEGRVMNVKYLESRPDQGRNDVGASQPQAISVQPANDCLTFSSRPMLRQWKRLLGPAYGKAGGSHEHG